MAWVTLVTATRRGPTAVTNLGTHQVVQVTVLPGYARGEAYAPARPASS